ncbi:winged helix DNA-binding domain-containing protein, partial [Streptomyces sp. NPDC059627]
AALLKDMARAGAPDAAWLAEVESATLAELARRGQATATELAAAEPRLREQFPYAAGKSYEGVHTVSTRLLRVLGVEGKVVRGRPLGSWTSSQFRWAPAPDHPELDPAEAQAVLLNRWLHACGPATEADLKWWTGWRVTEVRRALTAIGAEQVTLDEGDTGYVTAGDLPEVPGPSRPWAVLLPALDPTAMAWQRRDWYLPPELRPLLFDRSGNVGPTVWWNGLVVGGWAQRRDGGIVWRIPDPGIRREAEQAIEAEAERLRGWVGTARVTPRFRTPMERELSG